MKACKHSLLLLVAITLVTTFSAAQVITSFAGKAMQGYSGDGGQAGNCLFNKPVCIAIDKAGNLFVTDFHNNVVRKINTTGIVSTVAGNNTAGYSGDGGSATATQLNGPWGIAVDTIGNIYIADKENHAIRKVNTTGIITTIAGKGKPGLAGDGKPAADALLNHPLGLAVDNAGNLYIADNSNTLVRQINPAGIITTFAGNRKAGYSGDGGPATRASFKNIRYIACDNNGNVYISDTWNSVVRKVDAAGIVTTVAGNHTMKYTGDGSHATAAGIYFPVGITVALDGSLFIADNHNHVIRKVDNNGIITTVAGNGTKGSSGNGGPATAAQLANPTSIAIDGAGKLYVVEFPNNTIRLVNIPEAIKATAPMATSTLNVYPNPSHGAFTVALPEYKVPANITIIDAVGKTIEVRLLETGNAQNVPFTLSNVAAGDYIVKVVAGDKAASVKIVIE